MHLCQSIWLLFVLLCFSLEGLTLSNWMNRKHILKTEKKTTFHILPPRPRKTDLFPEQVIFFYEKTYYFRFGLSREFVFVSSPCECSTQYNTFYSRIWMTNLQKLQTGNFLFEEFWHMEGIMISPILFTIVYWHVDDVACW